MNVKSVSQLKTKALVAALMALTITGCSSGEDQSVAETTEAARADTDPDTTEAAPADTDPDTTSDTESDVPELFPDVVAVEATSEGGNSWSFSVTLSSPYDSPERYADSWRVVGPDGTVYGERFLTHDHAGEQPFTRSQSGIEIPEDVDTVTVEGRDQVSGWGGATMEFTLTR